MRKIVTAAVIILAIALVALWLVNYNAVSSPPIKGIDLFFIV